jgi:hypothetical protein
MLDDGATAGRMKDTEASGRRRSERKVRMRRR